MLKETLRVNMSNLLQSSRVRLAAVGFLSGVLFEVLLLTIMNPQQRVFFLSGTIKGGVELLTAVIFGLQMYGFPIALYTLFKSRITYLRAFLIGLYSYFLYTLLTTPIIID